MLAFGRRRTHHFVFLIRQLEVDRLEEVGVVEVHLLARDVGHLVDVPRPSQRDVGLDPLHPVQLVLAQGPHLAPRSRSGSARGGSACPWSRPAAYAPFRAAFWTRSRGSVLSSRSKHSIRSVSPAPSRVEWLIRISARASQRGSGMRCRPPWTSRRAGLAAGTTLIIRLVLLRRDNLIYCKPSLPRRRRSRRARLDPIRKPADDRGKDAQSVSHGVPSIQ